MEITAIVLGVTSVMFTVVPFIHVSAWWIRIFDFPRVQIVVLCLISIILLVFYGSINHIILLCLVTAAFIYQLILILNFTPFRKVDAPATDNTIGSFSILQLNVLMRNKQVQKVKNTISKEQPDIISLNEPNAWWANELAYLDDVYPYSIKKPLENKYGMMLFSKFPLKNTSINFLVEEDVPSFFTTVDLQAGEEFDLYCVHPRPPRPGSSALERNVEILIIGKQIKNKNRPAIVVGDLNDVAWSYSTIRFIKYSGVLDPRKGRGMFNTFNAHIPFLRFPVDHCFYTKHFLLIYIKRLDAVGSDHFPITIRLNQRKD